ncbi:hypothetical protein KY348_07320 [Candidatus Woesearchaeota archaeon]|nr:hypothetical protein [Candidatus Woesearchaeota archaeon]
MPEQEQGKEEFEGKEESEIKKLMEKIGETNRKLEEAYDEKIKRLEAKKKLIPDEKEEEKHQTRISALKEKLDEIKNRISEARKAGKDPFIAGLWLRNVNAKIKIAQVTHEKKDFKTVEIILNNAEKELEESLKQEEVDVKKEIETRLRKDVAKETGRIIET